MLNITRDILNLKIVNAVSGEILSRNCRILVNGTDLSFCALAVTNNLGKASKNIYFPLGDVINVNTESVVCVYNEKNAVDKTAVTASVPLFELETCDENQTKLGDIIGAEFEKKTGRLICLSVKSGQNSTVIPADRITGIYSEAKKLLISSFTTDHKNGDGRMDDMQSKIDDLTAQLQKVNALVNKLSTGGVPTQVSVPSDDTDEPSSRGDKENGTESIGFGQSPVLNLVKENEKQISSGDLFMTPEARALDQPNIADMFTDQQMNLSYVPQSVETEEALWQNLNAMENERNDFAPSSSVNQVLSEMTIGVTESAPLTPPSNESGMISTETQQVADSMRLSQDSYNSVSVLQDTIPMVDTVLPVQDSYRPLSIKPEKHNTQQTPLKPQSEKRLATDTPLSPVSTLTKDSEQKIRIFPSPKQEGFPMQSTPQSSDVYASAPVDTESVKKAAAEILAQMPSVTAQKKARAKQVAQKDAGKRGFETSETLVKGVAMVAFLVVSFILRKNGVF